MACREKLTQKIEWWRLCLLNEEDVYVGTSEFFFFVALRFHMQILLLSN